MPQRSEGEAMSVSKAAKAEWPSPVPDSPPPPPAESLRTLRAVIEERCWGPGDTAGLQSNAALEQASQSVGGAQQLGLLTS